MTPLVLAQIPAATPAGMGWWLVNLASVLAILYMGMKVFQMLFPRRVPPLEKEIADTFASKVEVASLIGSTNERFNGVSAKVERTRLELKQDVHDLGRNVEERDANLQSSMQQIFSAIGELRGELRARFSRGGPT